MREIKFRAWNTRRSEGLEAACGQDEFMVMIDDMYWFEENYCHVIHNGDDDYVIQQYTGLKDKKVDK